MQIYTIDLLIMGMFRDMSWYCDVDGSASRTFRDLEWNLALVSGLNAR
jgi:hypothetical protein